MPIYEYRCESCGIVFSQLITTFRQAEQQTPPCCTECGGSKVRRLISQIASPSSGSTDPGEGAAERASEERTASFTSKSTIDSLRAGKRGLG